MLPRCRNRLDPSLHGQNYASNMRVTADRFRSLALEISGAIESSHMNHPDFRIGGRIFASLGYPDDKHGMVKFTPEQQRNFLKKAPGMFSPCAGAWGHQGATSVKLTQAKIGLLRTALKMASKNLDAKKKNSLHLPTQRMGRAALGSRRGSIR